MVLYILLAVLGGALLGALVVFVVLRSKQFALQTQNELSKQELEYVQKQLQDKQQQMLLEKQTMQAEADKRLQEERTMAEKRLQEERYSMSRTTDILRIIFSNPAEFKSFFLGLAYLSKRISISRIKNIWITLLGQWTAF